MGPTYALAFLPDGKSFVTGGAEGVVRIHDAVHGTLLAEVMPFPLESDSDPAPSPRGEGWEGGGAGTRQASAPHRGRPSEPPPVEFLTDVMPVLAKIGCNGGKCHGSRTGQNGFGLSLRGYDPLGDFRALTDDLAGRRINRSRPESSLMLLKPIGRRSARRRRGARARVAALRGAAPLDCRRGEVQPARSARGVDRRSAAQPRAPIARRNGERRGHGALHRRHAARRDGRFVHRERRHGNGHGRRGGHADRRAARRGADSRPLRRRLRGDDAHRHGRSRGIRADLGADLQPHRRTGRRQARADADRRERAVHR